jgi:hypothetical protein
MAKRRGALAASAGHLLTAAPRRSRLAALALSEKEAREPEAA